MLVARNLDDLSVEETAKKSSAGDVIMGTEWGLFNDEGLVEGDFWSEESADAARTVRYRSLDQLDVDQVCEGCRNGRADHCEECGDDEEHDGDHDDDDDDGGEAA